MTAPVVVINIVGLSSDLLGENTPNLNRLAADGFRADVTPILPAVTCPAQSTILTGTLPEVHGVVANGWYFRDLSEVWFWRQSNRLVQSEKVWETARQRRPDLKTAVLFWWHNMYSTAELSVTLRPIYPADGRKIPALYSHPADLATRCEKQLGPFPMFNFWGPKSDLKCSQWIADAAAQVFREEHPDLLLVYLPHLDYCQQKLGPAHPSTQDELRRIDATAGALISEVRNQGAEVVVLSEYGIEEATAPVHINRALRKRGFISVRETLGWELLDPGASRAFAVSDHQIAHVYVHDPADVAEVAELLLDLDGVDEVLRGDAIRERGLGHARAGELVCVAAPRRWFSYYYWLDDSRAPDFARTVDIHRKPGFDPAELFLDPDRPLVGGRVLWNLAKKKAGFRYLMDVIPLKAELVRGTHGRDRDARSPVLLCSNQRGARDRFAMPEIRDFLLVQLEAERNE